jgi:dTDP-4-dehydrorhamnose reductase
LAACPEALIVRTCAFFGPWDDFNFLTVALRELEAGRTFRAAADSFVSPTYVPDLVAHTLDLLIDGESGIWHLANEGAVSWYDFAKLGAEMAGVDAEFLIASGTSEIALAASRPLYSVLSSEKAWVMPTLPNALERYAVSRSTVGRLLRAA